MGLSLYIPAFSLQSLLAEILAFVLHRVDNCFNSQWYGRVTRTAGCYYICILHSSRFHHCGHEAHHSIRDTRVSRSGGLDYHGSNGRHPKFQGTMHVLTEYSWDQSASPLLP